jgi:hypothetical protein
VISHHGIQLALFVLLIELNDMKAQQSTQINLNRSIPIAQRRTSGADAHRAVEDSRAQGMPFRPDQPEQRLNVLLDILVGYQASLQN